MNLTPIEQWIADCALATLRHDDNHPNVGMGMMVDTAIDLAFEAAKETSAVFAGGPEFFILSLPNIDECKIAKYVRSKR